MLKDEHQEEQEDREWARTLVGIGTVVFRLKYWYWELEDLGTWEIT